MHLLSVCLQMEKQSGIIVAGVCNQQSAEKDNVLGDDGSSSIYIYAVCERPAHLSLHYKWAKTFYLIKTYS